MAVSQTKEIAMLGAESAIDGSMVHMPQVAGSFYPDKPETCSAFLSRCIVAGKRSSIVNPKLIIAPHAGMAYSGAIAASAFRGLSAQTGAIKRVVVMGPAHRYPLQGMALHPATSWRTPMGDIPVAWDMLRRLKAMPQVSIDAQPFAGEHSIEMHLPFLQAVLGKFELLPVLVGDVAPSAVAEALERIWGGAETLICISSDLSHFKSHAEAVPFDHQTRQMIESLNVEGLSSERACGHRAIAGALMVARNLDMRLTGTDIRTSGDTTDDQLKVVGYGAFMGEYAAACHLAARERHMLLATAAKCLEKAIETNGVTPNLTINGVLPPTLTASRATFVTLEKAGRLRGCVGSLRPYQPLMKDVVANTVKAGFSDPRFDKLTREELDQLDLSISILAYPRLIKADSEDHLLRQLSPDNDGLIIADRGRSALFLPQVWTNIPDPKLFLTALRQKAGLPGDHWSPTFMARRFSVEKFGASVKELLAKI